MQNTIAEALLLFGVAQGFIVAAIILVSRFFKSEANRYLGYTIFLVALTGTLNQIIELGYEPPILILINDMMWEYLFPVTILFYFACSFQHPLIKNKNRFYLFIPFVLTAIINIIIDLEVDFKVYNIGMEENESQVASYYFVEVVLGLVFNLGVVVWTYFMVRDASRKMEELFKKNWFWQFWYLIAALIIFWIIDFLTDIYLELDLLNYLYSGVFILFIWVSYRGIYQFKLASDKFEIREILNEVNLQGPIKETKQENVHLKRLEKLIHEEHIHRDPEINRDIVAKKLGISSGYFSQIFNANFDQNFSEYINSFRVEDVRSMLLDSAFDQYSLLAIGFEAGFKSKSNFYTVFKKHTGLTPSAFKQQAKKRNIQVQNS